MVAAGMWNPIVFRRINKTWRADDLIAAMEDFYLRAENLLWERFYHPGTLLRKHSSELEKKLWLEKMPEEAFAPYLEEVQPPEAPHFKPFPYGCGRVHQAGHLNVPLFLEAARRYFEQHSLLRTMDVDFPTEPPRTNPLHFLGFHADMLIDCRGYRAGLEGFFTYLPFGLAKGEVLKVRCAGLDMSETFNAGFFLKPLDEPNNYQLGATFSWDRQDEQCESWARENLLERFSKHIDHPCEVLEQKAGVRPTTVDRRAMLGRHPEIPQLWIFNGLGAKGVMLAPFLAAHFAKHMLEGEQLDPEVDIARFASHYGK